MMRAVQVLKPGDAHSLVFTKLPKPTISESQILVRNEYSGVNFIDTYFRTGLYPAKMPMVLGEEGAGVIEQVGSGVADFKVGDRVAYICRTQSYAEYVALDPLNTLKLPDWMANQVGAASIIQGLTAITLTHASYRVKKGDVVLIHAAAGGTGRLLVQLCKHHGATVIATTSTQEKAQLVKALGADHVILYTKENIPEKVRLFTNGAMVNAVFDGVGKSTFQPSFDSLRRCGTFVSFGNASGKVPPIEINILSKGNIVLLRPMLYDYICTRHDFLHYASQLLDLIKSNVLLINICKIYNLQDAVAAHHFIEGRNTTGKILLSIHNSH